MTSIGSTAALLGLAALLEVGGGFLVWRAVRAEAGWLALVAGAAGVVGFALVIAQVDESSFGRTFAAYGGVFVVASLLWGWGVDGLRPDPRDWAGAGVIVAGVVLMLGSRGG